MLPNLLWLRGWSIFVSLLHKVKYILRFERNLYLVNCFNSKIKWTSKNYKSK